MLEYDLCSDFISVSLPSNSLGVLLCPSVLANDLICYCILLDPSLDAFKFLRSVLANEKIWFVRLICYFILLDLSWGTFKCLENLIIPECISEQASFFYIIKRLLRKVRTELRIRKHTSTH